MLFNSYPFVLGFLPVLILAYVLITRSPRSDCTPWLLAGASLFFYGWWNPAFLPLFLFSIGFNYSWALLLRNHGGEPAESRRNAVLGVGIAVNLALSFFFVNNQDR